MGIPDIVIDDGSHLGRYQIASFEVLFPLIAIGGLYVIEDLHTSYWPGSWEGGYRQSETGIKFLKLIIDDVHAWYHDEIPETKAQQQVSAVHIYDSIAVLEKRRRTQPRHIEVS